MYYIKRSARRLEGAAGRTPMAARRNRVNACEQPLPGRERAISVAG